MISPPTFERSNLPRREARSCTARVHADGVVPLVPATTWEHSMEVMRDKEQGVGWGLKWRENEDYMVRDYLSHFGGERTGNAWSGGEPDISAARTAAPLSRERG